MSDEEKKNWSKFAEEALNEGEAELESADEGVEASDDSAVGVLDHPSYKALEDKLTQAEQLAHENWEKSVRATAELDNFRKRAERDVEKAYAYGPEKLLTELLPVMDSLEQALASAQSDSEAMASMIEGIELTIKMFIGVLEKFSVTQIDPQGEAFDPNQHEAMSMQEAPEGVSPGTVMMVFQKGYLLKERVVRPARVIVAKGQVSQLDEQA